MPIVLDLASPAPPAPLPPSVNPHSPTLAQIEVELARRVGPFQFLTSDPQSPTSATASFAIVPSLQSTIDQDLVTHLYLLRRGVLGDGTPTPAPIPAYDRVRMVYSVDAASGRVVPDRPWQVTPYPFEQFEVHHLHPDYELLPAIQAGLRRCIFEDRVQLDPGYYYESTSPHCCPTSPTSSRSGVRKSALAIRPAGPVARTTGSAVCHRRRRWQRVAAHQRQRVLGAILGWRAADPAPRPLQLRQRRRPADWSAARHRSAELSELDWAVSAAHIEAWVRFPARDAGGGHHRATGRAGGSSPPSFSARATCTACRSTTCTSSTAWSSGAWAAATTGRHQPRRAHGGQ